MTYKTCLGNTSIHALHPEILGLIFKMNAGVLNDSDEWNTPGGRIWCDRALGNTISTSHIFNAWRTAILRSPSLWGGLIDVDYLMRLDAAGRDEVLRRAGDALSSSDSQLFVVSLLFENWKRIKHFHITIGEELFSKADWEPLYWPAKYLQFFSLTINTRTWNPNPVVLEGQLFSNDAPQLQVFESNLLLHLDTSATWLAHLRRLCLRETSRRMIPLGSLLDAVKVMRQLESLLLTFTAVEAPTTDVTPVSIVEMPSLLHIGISGVQVMRAIDFLDHLIPSRGCGLQAKLTVDPSFKDSVEAEHFQNTLARYARNWFEHNTHCHSLYITVSNHVLRIHQESIPRSLLRPLAIDFRTFQSHPVIVDKYFLLFAILSECDLTNVENLGLSLKITETSVPLIWYFFRPAFPNVELLCTSAQTLELITPYDPSEAPLFPKLIYGTS
ncbi:unnamed protein product [Cyclocybe aegerita]|uniref:Uncharacterized protein n=1 Tax=Cyclocybe aegerita TaxID=1973307 RepID=A0A8S0VQV6_CYCAE|nr:unnamed protein product [Cyclocybe aegerita]